jgi:hypothetical protein
MCRHVFLYHHTLFILAQLSIFWIRLSSVQERSTCYSRPSVCLTTASWAALCLTTASWAAHDTFRRICVSIHSMRHSLDIISFRLCPFVFQGSLRDLDRRYMVAQLLPVALHVVTSLLTLVNCLKYDIPLTHSPGRNNISNSLYKLNKCSQPNILTSMLNLPVQWLSSVPAIV